MSLPKQIARYILLFHGIFNIVQGVYSVFNPTAFANAAGAGFIGAPDKAIQSVGLGSIGVGAYGTLGAIQNSHRFYLTTVVLRILFAGFALKQWGWNENSAVILYEVSVALVAAVGALF